MPGQHANGVQSRPTRIVLLAACIVIAVVVYYNSGHASSRASTRVTATRQRNPALQRPLQAPRGATKSRGGKRAYHQRTIAIGDIHGDFPALTSLLRNAGLIDLRGNWIGGNDIFVQTGGRLSGVRI